jgi:hypothetical protein
MRTKAGAIAVLLFCVGAAWPVDAGTTGVVSLTDPSEVDAKLPGLTLQLQAEVAARSDGVLSPAQLRERMIGADPGPALSALDGKYREAVSSYGKHEQRAYDDSIVALNGILEELEKLPDDPRVFDQWVRALIRLAAAEFLAKHDKESAASIERLLRAAPEVAMALEYPPSFRTQVEEAKKRLARLQGHELTVRAHAEGTRVLVERRDVGTVPLRISLPPGVYRVSGRLGGIPIPSVLVDVRQQGQTIVLDTSLAETLRPASGPGVTIPPENRPATLASIGAVLGLDRLITASLRTDESATYLVGASFDVAHMERVREGRVPLSEGTVPKQSAGALAGFLVSGGVVPPVAQTWPPPPHSRTLGWVALGAGALGVGLGAFALVEGHSAQMSYDSAKSMTQGNVLKVGADPAHYQELVSSGNSARTTAYVAAVAAVVMVATAGIIGYINYKTTGDVGPFRF